MIVTKQLPFIGMTSIFYEAKNTSKHGYLLLVIKANEALSMYDPLASNSLAELNKFSDQFLTRGLSIHSLAVTFRFVRAKYFVSTW